tara:strand:- start:156 stop:914 length:759 start_codon:yes stop_codon:yes gene_type:complete
MKKIIITGGSGLVGNYLIGFFLKKKFKIFTTVLSDSGKKKLENNYKSFTVNGSLLIHKQDFEKSGFEKKIFNTISNYDFFPDVLINNARNLKNLDVKNFNINKISWEKEFNLSVIAPYKLTKILIEKSEESLKRVINISSIYGTVAINRVLQTYSKKPVPMNYSVCKAALIQMTKEFAAKYGNNEITFNSVSYGGITGRESPDFKKKYSELSPSGKMLEISEITTAIDFLIDKRSSAVNGHNLVVDGGWSIW